MNKRKIHLLQVISASILTCIIFATCSTYQEQKARDEQAEEEIYYTTMAIEDKPIAGIEMTEPLPVDDLNCIEEHEPETGIYSIGKFEITAYCSCPKCCGKWSDGITATGTQATEGQTVAVDPDVIPLGTSIIINGHEYIAEDTGSAVTGNVIDIYMCSHDEALEWGRQEVEVFINEK